MRIQVVWWRESEQVRGNLTTRTLIVQFPVSFGCHLPFRFSVFEWKPTWWRGSYNGRMVSLVSRGTRSGICDDDLFEYLIPFLRGVTRGIYKTWSSACIDSESAWLTSVIPHMKMQFPNDTPSPKPQHDSKIDFMRKHREIASFGSESLKRPLPWWEFWVSLLFVQSAHVGQMLHQQYTQTVIWSGLHLTLTRDTSPAVLLQHTSSFRQTGPDLHVDGPATGIWRRGRAVVLPSGRKSLHQDQVAEPAGRRHYWGPKTILREWLHILKPSAQKPRKHRLFVLDFISKNRKKNICRHFYFKQSHQLVFCSFFFWKILTSRNRVL